MAAFAGQPKDPPAQLPKCSMYIFKKAHLKFNKYLIMIPHLRHSVNVVVADTKEELPFY